MENKKPKVKKLFVEDLQRIRGGNGNGNGGGGPPCPEYTTLACGEEHRSCSGC